MCVCIHVCACVSMQYMCRGSILWNTTYSYMYYVLRDAFQFHFVDKGVIAERGYKVYSRVTTNIEWYVK